MKRTSSSFFKLVRFCQRVNFEPIFDSGRRRLNVKVNQGILLHLLLCNNYFVAFFKIQSIETLNITENR